MSEKLAALNVVYEKLKNANLSEFCLQLHSHKANKKEVIAELGATLNLPKSTLSIKLADEFAQHKEKAIRQLEAKFTDELAERERVFKRV